MNDLAKKCLWLIEALICDDSPNRNCSNLALTTGLSRRIVDDCVYDLVQRGLVLISPTSQLKWCGPIQAVQAIPLVIPPRTYESFASARSYKEFTPVKKFTELTDVEVDTATHDDLRAAYRALRAHHITETTQLYEKLKTLRAEKHKAMQTSILPRYVKADPPPIYDEIFEEGVKALDADAADEAATTICPQTGRTDCPGDHNYPCSCSCHGPRGWIP